MTGAVCTSSLPLQNWYNAALHILYMGITWAPTFKLTRSTKQHPCMLHADM